MTAPLRLLLVSVEAPPALNAEAHQVGKILAALQAHPDLVVDVATASNLPAEFTKPSDGQVIVLPCRLRRWQRIVVFLLAPWVPSRPDWWFLFAWRWRQVLRHLAHLPDLVYSRSFPLSSTFAAFHLARHFGVPWFLHLSDPWIETSLKGEKMQSPWHRRWERRCLSAAQRISFTSPITLARYQERYPELQHRMVLDSNSYEPTNLNSAPWVPGDRFRLVQTGSFTLGRWPDALFEVLLTLPSDHPMLQDLELIHAGPVDQHTRKLFFSAGPWLRDLGEVSSSNALQLQRSADLLLVVDYQFGSARDAQYLPSKLTDYLAIRRPVLAITDEHSASWRFVRDNRIGTPVAHGDPDALLAALLSYWQAWKARDRSLFELPPPSADYSASTVAGRIASAVRETLSPLNADSA